MLRSTSATPDADASYRVATSPGWHPYLQRLAADPAFDQLGHGAQGIGIHGGDAGWVAGLPRDVDLVHVVATGRMGAVADVEAFTAALDDRGLPLVLTVYDLHDRDARAPEEAFDRLDLLVDAADELTTVTRAAARRIRRRWGRRAEVIDHPHVAPLSLIGPTREVARRPVDPDGVVTPLRPDPVVIGAPLSASARSAWWDASTALSEVLASRADAVVELLDTDGRVLDDLVDHPLLDHPRTRTLRRPRMPDDRLFSWLRTVDVLLLPYRHATHSGWTRLCQDLGVRLVSVADESMLEMGLTASYAAGPEGSVAPDDVARAVVAAAASAAPDPDAPARRADLATICSAHRSVYGRVVAAA